MPGLVGFVHPEIDREMGQRTLKQMRDLITHRASYKQDELFCGGPVYASRTHLDAIQRAHQPFHQDGTYVWLDGEFFNRDELGLQGGEDPQVLSELYKEVADLPALKRIDGIFSAVIYDSRRHVVHLVTDRFGLRHLYWTVHEGGLFWTSEVKAVLALPGFRVKIDRRAVDQFFGPGYLLEDRTWFEGVQLLSSGTVLTWDIKEGSLQTRRYWWWDEIRKRKDLTLRDAAEEMGRLFRNAVERRCDSNEGIGVTLSGGLDSRAILAAIPARAEPIQAVTFGKSGCDDIRIARLAAKTKGSAHHVVTIDAENWFSDRPKGVWWTDGQLNLMHMHGIEALDSVERPKINLHGFLGDVVMGGSYVKERGDLEGLQSSELVAKQMACEPDHIENWEDYKSLDSAEYYLIQNRGRRFISGGTRMCATSIEQRKPFFDNELIEFLFSLPGFLRFRSCLYNEMLLHTFPSYFKTIPWRDTGVPIGWPRGLAWAAVQSRKVKTRFISPGCVGVADYPIWLRQDPARSFSNNLLRNSEAIYPDYIPRERVEADWESHLSGADHADAVCRYLTFEIWLQQVFEGRYRAYQQN